MSRVELPPVPTEVPSPMEGPRWEQWWKEAQNRKEGREATRGQVQRPLLRAAPAPSSFPLA